MYFQSRLAEFFDKQFEMDEVSIGTSSFKLER